MFCCATIPSCIAGHLCPPSLCPAPTRLPRPPSLPCSVWCGSGGGSGPLRWTWSWPGNRSRGVWRRWGRPLRCPSHAGMRRVTAGKRRSGFWPRPSDPASPVSQSKWRKFLFYRFDGNLLVRGAQGYGQPLSATARLFAGCILFLADRRIISGGEHLPRTSTCPFSLLYRDVSHTKGNYSIVWQHQTWHPIFGWTSIGMPAKGFGGLLEEDHRQRRGGGGCPSCTPVDGRPKFFRFFDLAINKKMWVDLWQSTCLYLPLCVHFSLVRPDFSKGHSSSFNHILENWHILWFFVQTFLVFTSIS